jgi:hypothetical protein
VSLLLVRDDKRQHPRNIAVYVNGLSDLSAAYVWSNVATPCTQSSDTLYAMVCARLPSHHVMRVCGHVRECAYACKDRCTHVHIPTEYFISSQKVRACDYSNATTMHKRGSGVCESMHACACVKASSQPCEHLRKYVVFGIHSMYATGDKALASVGVARVLAYLEVHGCKYTRVSEVEHDALKTVRPKHVSFLCVCMCMRVYVYVYACVCACVCVCLLGLSWGILDACHA